ncbi:MAG: glycoside hydrolase family 25 [Frankiales bacterium]|nr:glycoside hydrolase family 25 [Frankiales bacterium]
MLSSAPPVRRPFSARARLLSAVVAFGTFLGLGTITPTAQAEVAVTGIDISRWQHPNGVGINWGAVRNSGLDFAIIKATEATSYVNPYFVGDTAAARSVGLIVGAYDFARPSKPVIADAAAEARYFVNVIGNTVNEPGTLPPVLDLEQSGGLSDAELIVWTHTWLDTVQSLTGRLPMIYTYKNFWSSHMAGTAQFGGYPLWLAYYNDNLGGLVGHWPTWAIWQYSSGGSVPGISGRVDMNRFNGSLADLAAFANGGAQAEFVPTAPFPPVSVAGKVGDGMAAVSWLESYNGGSPITSYTVTLEPGGLTQTLPATARSARFSGLANGTGYRLSVSAANELGSSDPVDVRVVPNLLTTLRVTTSAAGIKYGASVAINGRLTSSDSGTPIAGAQVYLEGATSTSGGYSPIASLTTNADGRVSAVRTPRASATYRLRYAGGAAGRASLDTSRVVVRPVLAGKLNATRARVGSKLRLTGRVTPLHSGFVYRQQLVEGNWTTLDRATLGASGTYAFRVVPVKKGVKSYRVATRETPTFGSSASATIHLTVR